MFSLEGRVRYSETDRTGKMSMMGLLALFQDVGYMHGDDRGAGLAFTRKSHKTWYLLSWQIHAKEMPSLGQKFTVKTWFYRLRGPLAWKNILLLDENGKVLVEGDTMWAYMDLDAGKPTPAPEDQFPESDFGEKWEMYYAPRRIRIPEDAKDCPGILVNTEQVDTNGHVNNFRFAELAYRAVGSPEQVMDLQAEYVKQAYLGETLTPRVGEEEGQIRVEMVNGKGEPCATFSFGKSAQAE